MGEGTVLVAILAIYTIAIIAIIALADGSSKLSAQAIRTIQSMLQRLL